MGSFFPSCLFLSPDAALARAFSLRDEKICLVALAVLLGEAEPPELAEARLDLVVAGAALAVGAVPVAVGKDDESALSDASSDRTLFALTLLGTVRFLFVVGVCTAGLFCAPELFCAVQPGAVDDACALAPPSAVAFAVVAPTMALDVPALAVALDGVPCGAVDVAGADGADVDGADGAVVDGTCGAAFLR